jgi:hypothetical protein
LTFSRSKLVFRELQHDLVDDGLVALAPLGGPHRAPVAHQLLEDRLDLVQPLRQGADFDFRVRGAIVAVNVIKNRVGMLQDYGDKFRIFLDALFEPVQVLFVLGQPLFVI